MEAETGMLQLATGEEHLRCPTQNSVENPCVKTTSGFTRRSYFSGCCWHPIIAFLSSSSVLFFVLLPFSLNNNKKGVDIAAYVFMLKLFAQRDDFSMLIDCHNDQIHHNLTQSSCNDESEPDWRS